MGNNSPSRSTDRQGMSPTRVISDPSMYNSRLADSQVMLLRDKFCTYAPTGSLDLLGFSNMLGSNLPADLLKSVFHVFTPDKTISLQQLCHGYCSYIFASHSEQAAFLVSIFCPPGKASVPPKQLQAFRQFITGTIKETKSCERLDAWIKSKKTVAVEELTVWALDTVRLRLALRPLELIPMPRSECDQIKQLLDKNAEPQAGDRWCLISAQWMRAWKSYVQFDYDPMTASIMYYRGLPAGQRPIEINNNGLLQDAFQLRNDLVNGRDFEFVPEEVWELLFNWYDGGPKITREVVVWDGNIDIELYPLVFQVSMDVVDQRNAVTFFVSKMKRVNAVVTDAAYLLKQPLSPDLKLYLMTDSGFQQLHPNRTLEDLAGVQICVLTTLQDGTETTFTETDVFTVGEQLELRKNRTWLACVVSEVTDTHYVLTDGSTTYNVSKDQTDELRLPAKVAVRNPLEFGVNGIINIGNTCYAAAIIQTLAHTPLLGAFFTSNRYANHLTPAAKSDGGLCKLFANFLQILSSRRGAANPSTLLNSFIRTHKDFNLGFQQDGHEFLRALLDSLHQEIVRNPLSEDIHRTSLVENASPQQEQEVALNQWRQIQGPSGSAVSDFCVGQICRILSCPRCHMRVKIFESFMDLSLPMPFVPTMSVRFMSVTDADIRLYVLPYINSLETLYSKLEQTTKLTRSQLLAAHIKNRAIIKFIHQPQTLDDVKPPSGHLLCFYQVFGSIAEAEKASKPTQRAEPAADWRDTLTTDQLVDVKFQGGWVVGQIVSGQEQTVRVRLWIGNGIIQEASRSHPSLDSYRSHTRNNDEVLHIPLVMTWGTDDVCILGNYLVLSIGNWLTWQDFDKAVLDLCSKYVASGFTEERLYSLTISLTDTHACAHCGVIGCPEHHFSQSWDTLSWLSGQKNSVYIRVHWHNRALVYEPKLRRAEEAIQFTLADCFQELTATETLSRDCSKCANPQMTSRLQICQLPDILILHLKRFTFRDRGYVKSRNSVSFPIEGLDLTNWSLVRNQGDGFTVESAPDNFQFNLYSVVNHLGTIESGHYTAACLNSQNTWLYFNDDMIHRFTQTSDLVTPHAYILFYRRKRFTSSNVIGLA